MSAIVTDIRFKPASRAQRQTGLVGFVSCRLDGRWLLDDVRICETVDRRHVVAFPSRRDANGARHSILRPLDDETRMLVETAILGSLRRERRIP